MELNFDIKTFIETKLKNKNSKLEGQRLTEKYFLKNGFVQELNFFKEKDILNSKNLYKFINNCSSKCECSNEKRFKGFRDGFTEYCEKCARTKNNAMKKNGNNDVKIDEIIEFVKDKNLKYSSSKINSLSDKTKKELENKTSHLYKDVSIIERLYNLEHGITEVKTCKICNKRSKFRFSQSGYSDFCSFECSLKDDKIRLENSKLFHYNEYLKKFKSNEEYKIKMFNLDEFLSHGKCNIEFTHLKCKHRYTCHKDYQGSFNCPKCYSTKSRTQYELFSYIKREYDEVKYNDRKLIYPLEIDILIEEFKLAIEYNGLMFHSSGINSYSIFNKNTDSGYHLRKTELVEEKGYQLFHIFESEFLDSNKKEIWVSIIRNRLKLNNKLYARKCIIKEVQSKESNEFLEQNHLQGKCNASIRLGLYYQDELVSLMTFGKSRFNKNVEYELIRFCSKKNNSIIGAGSKLLSYFEKEYKPKSLISYANRRWSQGNLYEQLGFKFINCTNPNYFYFKKSNDKLLSRIGFQKHKLKEKLEIFDSNKTEIENMIENGYRVIYDSGNKVYIKEYKTRGYITSH